VGYEPPSLPPFSYSEQKKPLFLEQPTFNTFCPPPFISALLPVFQPFNSDADSIDPNEHLFVWFATPFTVYGKNRGNNPYFVGDNWLPYRNHPRITDWTHSQIGDWRPDLWDKTANQAFHFWYYVSVQFYDKAGWAAFANIWHDTPPKFQDYDYVGSDEYQKPPEPQVSRPDFILGKLGIDLGDNLGYESWLQSLLVCNTQQKANINPGEWIRANLKSFRAP